MHRMDNYLLPLTHILRTHRFISETMQATCRPTLLLYEDPPPFPSPSQSLPPTTTQQNFDLNHLKQKAPCLLLLNTRTFFSEIVQEGSSFLNFILLIIFRIKGGNT